MLDDKTAFVKHERGIGNLFEYGSCRPSLTSNSDRKAINFSKIAFNCLSYHRLRKQGYFYKHPGILCISKVKNKFSSPSSIVVTNHVTLIKRIYTAERPVRICLFEFSNKIKL